MYILKNAIISIVRNKGRNLLIGIIILVISCATAVTLAINNSSSSLIKSYEEKYEIEATLGVNRENMMGSFNKADKNASKESMQESFVSASSLSVDDILLYADSSYVKSYYYTMSVGVNALDLESASMSFDNGENNSMRKNGNFTNMSSSDFVLKGYSSIESMNEFITGSYKIIDGEVSDSFDSFDCIINSELATLNDISVGDIITVYIPDDEEMTYELTVTGIYEEDSADTEMQMFTTSVNTIITNTNVINEIKENNDNLKVTTNPTFILTSGDVVSKFQNELEEKGLNEYLTVQTNLEQVEGATKTISNVRTFAITFLVITLIIGTIVLLVINMINIRERKYEIGVLRTIGMKKSKVCLQFLYELIIVAVVSLLLGASIGAFISVPVSNHLLENEISSSETENINIAENFGKGGMNPNINGGNKNFSGVVTIQAFDSIDAVVDFKVLLELLGIGLIITLISGTSAIVSIQKFSPLTILKERS